jgi:hypothetical protein
MTADELVAAIPYAQFLGVTVGDADGGRTP